MNEVESKGKRKNKAEVIEILEDHNISYEIEQQLRKNTEQVKKEKLETIRRSVTSEIAEVTYGYGARQGPQNCSNSGRQRCQYF